MALADLGLDDFHPESRLVTPLSAYLTPNPSDGPTATWSLASRAVREAVLARPFDLQTELLRTIDPLRCVPGITPLTLSLAAGNVRLFGARVRHVSALLGTTPSDMSASHLVPMLHTLVHPSLTRVPTPAVCPVTLSHHFCVRGAARTMLLVLTVQNTLTSAQLVGLTVTVRLRAGIVVDDAPAVGAGGSWGWSWTEMNEAGGGLASSSTSSSAHLSANHAVAPGSTYHLSHTGEATGAATGVGAATTTVSAGRTNIVTNTSTSTMPLTTTAAAVAAGGVAGGVTGKKLTNSSMGGAVSHTQVVGGHVAVRGTSVSPGSGGGHISHGNGHTTTPMLNPTPPPSGFLVPPPHAPPPPRTSCTWEVPPLAVGNGVASTEIPLRILTTPATAEIAHIIFAWPSQMVFAAGESVPLGLVVGGEMEVESFHEVNQEDNHQQHHDYDYDLHHSHPPYVDGGLGGSGANQPPTVVLPHPSPLYVDPLDFLRPPVGQFTLAAVQLLAPSLPLMFTLPPVPMTGSGSSTASTSTSTKYFGDATGLGHQVGSLSMAMTMVALRVEARAQVVQITMGRGSLSAVLVAETVGHGWVVLTLMMDATSVTWSGRTDDAGLVRVLEAGGEGIRWLW